MLDAFLGKLKYMSMQQTYRRPDMVHKNAVFNTRTRDTFSTQVACKNVREEKTCGGIAK